MFGLEPQYRARGWSFSGWGTPGSVGEGCRLQRLAMTRSQLVPHRTHGRVWLSAAWLVAAWMVGTGVAGAQTHLEQGSYRVEITLERETPSGWEAVNPGLILEGDDLVRFRIKSNTDGYLHVTNRGTSGAYDSLFPSADAGEENRIQAGKQYRIPQTSGAFRLNGPAGHDVVYWILSPQPLPSSYRPLSGAPASPPAPDGMLPRCDETVLRARGECIDSSAGVRQSQERGSNETALRSRELLFVQKKKSSVVSAPEGLTGPVIFEFRIAHKGS